MKFLRYLASLSSSVPRNCLLVAVCVALGILGLGVSSAQQTVDAPFVAGELLLQFRPATSETQRDSARRAIGTRLLRRFENLDIEHVRLPQNMTVADAIRVLRASPEVLIAQPNYVQQMAASSPPDDPYWLNDSLWGLLKINGPAAWTNFGSGSGNVVVAVIDSGIDYTHPDLSANMWRNPGEIPGNGIDDDGNGYIDDIFGIDVVNVDSNPMDDNGHGTHTAGTIGALGNNGLGVAGVNWHVKLLACKFLNVSGSGSDAGAIACFNYIVALKQRGVNVRVSNNSW
jgi:hypothetical protein